MRKVNKLEEDALYEDDYQEVPPNDIVAYNELRSCADLFRMYNEHILEIQPEFQRDFVWKATDQTRFVDSLIKQLPIPSMCFSLDYKTQKWMVIDGLQRMSTIIRFLSEKTWRLSNLDDIDPKISGKLVSDFTKPKSELNILLNRVSNLTLPITVIRCDYAKKTHLDYLFKIFHRLNDGGTRLNNQEIRNCIFAGDFNSLLKKLNQNDAWRKINKIKADKTYRFAKEELILRFFAFYDWLDKYNGRLARFLNDYMENKRNLGEKELEDKEALFNSTVEYLFVNLFDKQAPAKMTNTVLEVLLYGISKNSKKLKDLRRDEAKEFYNKLMKHEALSEENLSERLSDKDKVLARLNAASEIFSGK